MTSQKKRILSVVSIIIILLLIPLVAMQFTDEVKWTAFDFLAASILLIITGLTFEILMRKVKKVAHKIAVCMVLFLALFLIWIELAVGLFGTPFGGL